MRKVKNWKILATLALAVIGIVFSWFLTLYSEELSLVKNYVISSPDVSQEHILNENIFLVSYHISLKDDGKSRYTFLCKTEEGYKWITFILDKKSNPWLIYKLTN